MKFYVVVSVTPDGSKALVGHYKHFEQDSWRSEVYEELSDATHQRDNMESMFAFAGMKYEVREFEV